MANTPNQSETVSLVEKALAQRSDLAEPFLPSHREFLTKLLEVQGAEKFSLLQGLREPNNSRERNLLEFYFESDEAEREEILRRFAERPVDAEMLEEYHTQIEHDLQYVGNFLQAVIRAANECEKYGDPSAGRRLEREAHDACAKLQQKWGMYTTEMETCGDFLADMNSKQGQGVVELGEISANSWHELTLRTAQRIVESWKSCCDISNKSGNRMEYAYEASASSLFVNSHRDEIPKPQQVDARVRDEYRRAKHELSLGHADPGDSLNTVEILEAIGSGMYGRVYKGFQRGLERFVAIKIIKGSGEKTADVCKRQQFPNAHPVFCIDGTHPTVRSTIPSSALCLKSPLPFFPSLPNSFCFVIRLLKG